MCSQHSTIDSPHFFDSPLAFLHELKHLGGKLMLTYHSEAAGIPSLRVENDHRAQTTYIIGNLLIRILAEIERIIVHFDFYRIEDFVEKNIQIDYLILGSPHVTNQSIGSSTPILAKAPEWNVWKI